MRFHPRIDGVARNVQKVQVFVILADRGYDDAAIEKILGGNVLRVWEQVEDARRKRKF